MPNSSGNRLKKVATRFDARAATYDTESLWVHDKRVVRALTANLPSPKSTILEVAAGTGVVAAACADRGHSTTCTDISVEMLVRARARGLRTVACDMHKLPFRQATFNVAILRQGLQYARIRTALREMARVATDELRIAQIIARTERQAMLWQRLFALLGQSDRRVFHQGEIRRLGEHAGLTWISTSKMQGQERLLGPNSLNASYSDAQSAKIEQLMRAIDSNARFRGGDWLHRIGWEIVTFRIRSAANFRKIGPTSSYLNC